MVKDYKAQKEAFVANLSGGTVSEICLVTLVAPASVLLFSALQARLHFFQPYGPLQTLVDFLLNCSAILVAVTIYSSAPVTLNLLLALPAIAICLAHPPNRPKYARPTPKDKGDGAQAQRTATEALPAKPFITTYRGAMLVITFIAILAVDFKAFPRRFAKAENWGTSLMDLGVGSFVFSAGTVSARPVLRAKISKTKFNLARRLKTAFRHSLPLLVLGAIRLYSVKGLEYAEHVSEYGVHWNFFFTLALLPPFTALCDAFFQYIPSYSAIGLAIAIAYEVCLESTDLTKYILVAPRTDLLSKNREGIFSFFGYLAIFLIGQATGMYLLPGEPRPPRLYQSAVFKRLALWSAVWSALFIWAIGYPYGANLRVSRRLANLPYVLGVAAFNCCQILLFYVIEMALFANSNSSQPGVGAVGPVASPLLTAVNRNGLVLFLLANLLTGIVNMTMPTLFMSSLEAVAVLLVYMGVIAGVALFLNAKDVSIKL